MKKLKEITIEDKAEKKGTEKIIKELHQIALDFKELGTEKEIFEITLKAAENLLNFK